MKISETAIYRKTAKGLDEMTTRSNQLPSRLRSLLVMVDGKSSGADLLKKAKAFGDPEAFVGQLIAEGFIEATAAPPVMAVVTHAAPSGPDPLLKTIVQLASHQLIDKLGPSADALTARLDACRNHSELADTLAACRDAVHALAGRRKGEEFWTLVSARLAQT